MVRSEFLCVPDFRTVECSIERPERELDFFPVAFTNWDLLSADWDNCILSSFLSFLVLFFVPMFTSLGRRSANTLSALREHGFARQRKCTLQTSTSTSTSIQPPAPLWGAGIKMLGTIDCHAAGEPARVMILLLWSFLLFLLM